MPTYRMSRLEQLELSANPAMRNEAIKIFLSDAGFNFDRQIWVGTNPKTQEVIYMQED